MEQPEWDGNIRAQRSFQLDSIIRRDLNVKLLIIDLSGRLSIYCHESFLFHLQWEYALSAQYNGQPCQLFHSHLLHVRTFYAHKYQFI